ncbi:MAG: hypothetical protein J6T04_04455 [Bacteroidales bacterium]|nr:hypothetical protein [Bacteroidales bacterium]
MGKKKKGRLGLAIVLMVISFMITRNLRITRYNPWFIVFILIVAISILILVLVKNKRGDFLTDYCIKIFCYVYFLFTVTEIIYLEFQPTRYYSSELTGAYRKRTGTRSAEPAYFEFKIDNHYCKYYDNNKTIETIRKRKPSIIVYVRGEYRRGLISSIQIRSFELDTIHVP